MKFREATGNWTDLRSLGNMAEIDFHYGSERDLPGYERESFESKMDRVHQEALLALREAQAQGKDYVLFTHGYSTSGPGQRSARSVVLSLMRSKEATPYIVRSRCLEHRSVFVAAIRPARKS